MIALLPRRLRIFSGRPVSRRRFLEAHSHPEEDPVRVNVGCGNHRKPGYIGVDVRSDSAADYVVPAFDLHEVFKEASVLEVYSRHMLEHLDPDDASTCLRSWYHVLAPGGFLNVIVPDLEFHCRQLLGQARSKFEDQAAHALASFYGWRRREWGGSIEDAHRWGYTCATLRRELEAAGFIDITRITKGQDSAPWHLNLMARKPDGRGSL